MSVAFTEQLGWYYVSSLWTFVVWAVFIDQTKDILKSTLKHIYILAIDCKCILCQIPTWTTKANVPFGQVYLVSCFIYHKTYRGYIHMWQEPCFFAASLTHLLGYSRYGTYIEKPGFTTMFWVLYVSIHIQKQYTNGIVIVWLVIKSVYALWMWVQYTFYNFVKPINAQLIISYCMLYIFPARYMAEACKKNIIVIIMA